MSFLNSFTEKIIYRGLSYYRNNNVLDCEKIDDSLYKGTVKGSHDNEYDVLINLDNPDESSCNCKYAQDGNMCKHMTALYFSIFTEEVDLYIEKLEKYYRDKKQEQLENGIPDDDKAEALYNLVETILEDNYKNYDYSVIDDITDDCLDEFDNVLDLYSDDIESALKDGEFQGFVYNAMDKRMEAESDDEEDDEEIIETVTDVGYPMFMDKDIRMSRKDHLFDNITNYYDINNKKIGYSRKDLLFDNITNYYDTNNKLIGYSRKDFLFDNITNYYDTNNKKIGYSRKDFLFDHITNYYDNNRKKIGESKEDILFKGIREYKRNK